jgi:hypothetical protein
MSIKLILAFLLVGLACYMFGRLSGRRGEGGGEPMLRTSAPRTLDAASLEEIKRLVRGRQLISAIKIYHEQTGCGLRESKEAVESIAKSL